MVIETAASTYSKRLAASIKSLEEDNMNATELTPLGVTNILEEEKESKSFADAFERIAFVVSENARLKGFHDAGLTKGDRYALIHSEVSEAFECARAKVPPESEKCPGFSHEVEELADAIIRIMDFAICYNMPLGEAIIAKALYNTTRPYMHGKKM